MIIKIIAVDVMKKFENPKYNPEYYNVQMEKNDSLNDLREKIELKNISISFDKYYGTSSNELISLEDKIPFIINKNQKVEWECDFDDVTIDDFIRTNKINLDDGMQLEYGYPQAGGVRDN